MTVIVTGAAGFIGSHLCDKLVGEGYRVVGVDNLTTGTLDNVNAVCDAGGPQFDFVLGDVSDTRLMEKLVETARPSAICHLAASKMFGSGNSVHRDLTVNAGGTLNLLEACRNVGGVRKFVYASTGSVYGRREWEVQTETHPTAPISHYGVSKLAADKYVSLYRDEYGLPATTLRYFHVYGPRQSDGDDGGGVVGIFCRRIAQGLHITVHGGDQWRNFTHVDDVVNATFLALYTLPIDTYNCVSNEFVTINGLVEMLKALSEKKVVVERTEMRQGDVEGCIPDNSKLSRYITWTPFTDGLIRTFDWYTEKYRDKQEDMIRG